MRSFFYRSGLLSRLIRWKDGVDEIKHDVFPAKQMNCRTEVDDDGKLE